MPCVPCVCSTSLLLTDVTPICKRVSPPVSRAFQSFPPRESQLVGGKLPRPCPPSPRSRDHLRRRSPHSLPSPRPPLGAHASKDHRRVGFEKLLFSSGAKSSFAASTAFGVVWGFAFFPTRERTAIRSLPYSFDAQPTVKSELVL